MNNLTRSALYRLASLRLTVGGLVLLAAVVLAAQVDARVPSWCTSLPLGLLAANLTASLATHPRLRRGGLAVFHIALLGALLLLAWGRLTHFEGRVEITQGAAFDPALVEPTSVGLWHGQRLQRVQFEQGPIEVRYAPGLKRARTISAVSGVDGRPGEVDPVGDDRPLRVQGFRFYTTHNKGFAPLLSWTAPGRATLTGAVHLPSYPLFDWQQLQHWTPPGGPPVKLWLRLPQALNEHSAWRLRPDQVEAVLIVEVDGQRFELQPGQSATGTFGSLRHERLLGWMGYRIHYDPTLTALWWLACLAVGGLLWHLWPMLFDDGLWTRQSRSGPVPVGGALDPVSNAGGGRT